MNHKETGRGEKPDGQEPEAPGIAHPTDGQSSVSDNSSNEATVFDAAPLRPDTAQTIVDGKPISQDPDVTVFDLPSVNAKKPDAKNQIDPQGTWVDVGATIAPGTQGRSASGARQLSDSYASATFLQIGALLGDRYEVLQLLGEGGMGAVYKAADRELDRFVALKVIRPELASNPAILARFKQELLLSHQVTHRNVIRIYDLGEAQGVKFITMEFIEGRDLRNLSLEKKKFTPEEAVDIIQQVCLALEAAHNVGVIHRDLKPQNIMQDGSGRILVMDFGLARTVGGDGMTQTGAIVGTMEYMSPEQALGKELDQRSDIFSLGLILYEMLTGKSPFAADSALASLIKRTQERAIPVSEIDAEIPGALSGVVSKCLERDLTARYKTVADVLADLNNWKDKRAAGTLRLDANVKPWGQTFPWPIFATIVTGIVLLLAGYIFRDRLFHASSAAISAPAPPATSLAILPFRNASGDQTLDWLGPSLADMLSTDVGQSPRLRTVNPANLHQIFSDLRLSSGSVLDPATIRRVADFSSADRVVWGQYARFGSEIRIDATLEDIKNNRNIPLKVDVPSEKEIPSAIDQLAESIRQKLALPDDVVKELKATSFQASSTSVDALRDYDQGLALQRDGKDLEAQKRFELATKEDPNFALALSRLAQTYSSLGYDAEAEQSAKKAVGLSQDLPNAAKYLISAIELQVAKNTPEAIKAYENLAKVSPDNSDVRAALAKLYEDSGDFPKARDYDQKILSSNPKDLGATIDLGRIAIRSGNAQDSLDPLNRAYSLAVQLDNPEQKAYSLHYTAVAYRVLNKPDEVLRSEQEALAIWRSIGQKKGEALSLNEMARAQAALGKNKDAMANFQEALQIRRDIGDKRGLGDTLIDMGNLLDDRVGDHDGAVKMYKEALDIERELGNESLQATCLNNIGSVYSEKNQFEDALTYFQQVLQLREKAKVPKDIVDAVHNLGQVSASMGQYDQAVTYYMRALDLRRSMNDTQGVALESYALGALFDFQGRYGAAVKAKEDAVKTLRELKDRSAWMATVLGSYGEALILAGRGDEATAPLEEALSLSHELKNDTLVAQTLLFKGDGAYYDGNLKAAQSFYQQALQAAAHNKDYETTLLAKVNLAKIQVREKNGHQVISTLRTLSQQADESGLKYASVDCSLSMAEAMMQNHDNAHARQELQRALLRSDKLGQQGLSAEAHYLLATAARESGDQADAKDNYRGVVNILDTLKKDPGAEKLLQRADFKLIYEDSTRSLQGPKK